MRNAGRVASSSRYRIFETQEYLDCLPSFAKSDQDFVQSKAKTYIYPQFRREPHIGVNIKKLVDYRPETWRYRLGRFRLFCSIDEKEKVISNLSIDFRKDAYR